MLVLFQGDSITDGNRYREKSSRWDLNHQIGHSYAYIVSGILGLRYPKKDLRFVNRGVSADTTRELTHRWQEDALEVAPDLLSLLIGTNDCFIGENGVSPSQYRENLDNLLNMSFQKNSKLGVILMEPFFLPTTGEYALHEKRCREKITEYAKAARETAASDSRILFLPLQQKFDEAAAVRECGYWIWDGIHPTESGHALIAREWIAKFEREFMKIDDI